MQATAGAKPIASTHGELRVLHRPNAGMKLNQAPTRTPHNDTKEKRTRLN